MDEMILDLIDYGVEDEFDEDVNFTARCLMKSYRKKKEYER